VSYANLSCNVPEGLAANSRKSSSKSNSAAASRAYLEGQASRNERNGGSKSDTQRHGEASETRRAECPALIAADGATLAISIAPAGRQCSMSKMKPRYLAFFAPHGLSISQSDPRPKNLRCWNGRLQQPVSNALARDCCGTNAMARDHEYQPQAGRVPRLYVLCGQHGLTASPSMTTTRNAQTHAV
jgi:hypothetical protein